MFMTWPTRKMHAKKLILSSRGQIRPVLKMKMPSLPEKKAESWQKEKIRLARTLIEQNDSIIELLSEINNNIKELNINEKKEETEKETQ